MNNFNDVNDALFQVNLLSGRNDKIAALAKYLQDPLFTKVIQYALSSDKIFHIEKFPAYKSSMFKVRDAEHRIFVMLDNLSAQTGATTQDKLALYNIACSSLGTYEVVKRILKKDLKCGVGAKSINVAVPGTIFYVPYCRCSSDSIEDKFWKKPGKRFAQLKEDGMFANVIINGDTVHFLSRNGIKIKQLDVLGTRILEASKRAKIDNVVGTGELLIIRDGNILDRQVGNGILNKLIHGTAPKEEADSVAIRLWDLVPHADFWNDYESSTPYKYRFENIKSLVAAATNFLYVDTVYTEMVKSKEDGQDFYRRMRLLGHEGAVLKDPDAKWADHTSPGMMKMKNVSTCALILTGWKLGKEDGKYEDVMGALFFESRCGKLKVTVNGKSDEMRAFDWDKEIGSIWTVEFERVSYSKSKTTASLYLPRIQKQRHDRTMADTLEEIVARSKKGTEAEVAI